MHEVIPGARVEGSVLLDGEDIYGSNVDPVGVRKTIGMVFQRPNPFPTMSIKDNVVAGLKLQGERSKKKLDEVRSEEHTSELQSLMRNSYAVFCLKKKQKNKITTQPTS